MLLKHLLIILALLLPALSQSFKSGLLQLTSTSTLPSFTIPLDNKTNDIIISLSAFTAGPKTSCSITSKSNQQANFNCTGNVDSIAYLFYEKSPLVYSNSFSYYFLVGGATTKAEYALWAVDKQWTIAQQPKIRAVLTGFVATDDLVTMIEVKGLADGWTINISRTLNVKIVSFSYILIQNYSPYNLTFVDSAIQQSSDLKLSGVRANYINFWGIQSLKTSRKQLSTPFGLQLSINSSSSLASGTLAIGSFSISDNTMISGLFLIDNRDILSLSLNCRYSYFNVSSGLCQQKCQGYTYNWNISQLYYRYCLEQQPSANGIVVYSGDNLGSILNYTFSGCAQAEVKEDVRVVCKKCKKGYKLYGQSCICDFGSFQVDKNECQICKQQLCELSLSNTPELIKNKDKISIKVTVKLPKNQNYLNNSSPSFQITSKINDVDYLGTAEYNQITKFITVTVEGVKSAVNYSIELTSKTSNSETWFYISRGNTTFLWSLSATTTLTLPASSQQIVMTSIAPIFKESDKSVPLILLIAFFLGDKINTLSLFQTVSLIYLVNFISIGQHYNSLLDLISKIFIFQPKPLFTVFGSQQSWVSVPQIDAKMVNYSARVGEYSQKEMFLAISLNCLCSMAIQIGAIVGIIKIGRKCVQQSSNQISPEGAEAVSKAVDLRRSEVKDKGVIKWRNEPQIRSQASFKYKIYIYLTVLDQKKWVVISSLWSMYVLSFSFLIFYELTLPLDSLWAFLSRFSCYCFLVAILSFPFLLIRYQPLYLHKCLGLCYKRKQYKTWQLWLYYFIVYIQNVVFAFVVVGLDQSTYQLSTILLVLVIKFIIFRTVIKKIEMLRLFAIFGFFSSVLISSLVDPSKADTMIEVMTGCLLLVIAIELLKLLRGVILTILKFFKEKREEPNKKGKNARENIQVEVLKPIIQRNQSKLKKEVNSPGKKMKKEQENQFLQDSSKGIGNVPPTQPIYRSKAFRRRLLNLRS